MTTIKDILVVKAPDTLRAIEFMAAIQARKGTRR